MKTPIPELKPGWVEITIKPHDEPPAVFLLPRWAAELFISNLMKLTDGLDLDTDPPRP